MHGRVLYVNWTKINDRVIRSRNGRWQIARYQDVPVACYELWDIAGVDFNARDRKRGTLITTDRDPQRLRGLAAHHELMDVV